MSKLYILAGKPFEFFYQRARGSPMAHNGWLTSVNLFTKSQNIMCVGTMSKAVTVLNILKF